MVIKRHMVKSCCGNRSYIFESETPVTKAHLEDFKKQGYSVPPHYEKTGLFHIELHRTLVATASFGATKVSVRCTAANCSQLMDSFANSLDILTRKKR